VEEAEGPTLDPAGREAKFLSMKLNASNLFEDGDDDDETLRAEVTDVEMGCTGDVDATLVTEADPVEVMEDPGTNGAPREFEVTTVEEEEDATAG